jgi:GntR family transcriptional regulator
MASDSLLGPVDRDSDVPLGAQLAARVRGAVGTGGLGPGERLPSVRELAEAVGVNVNTVRAVYGRLESEGLVRSEHGRGTFVTGPADASTRRELRRQIAELETELGRRAPQSGADPFTAGPRSPGARLPTTAELAGIRDELLTRLQELDAERGELVRRLAALDVAEPVAARRSTPSLRGARVRWVGV